MDFFGNGWEDPKSQAIMALSAGLLRKDMGGGLLAANDAFNQAKRAKAQEQLGLLNMQRAQLDMTRAQKDHDDEMRIQDIARKSYRSPELASWMSMGPTPNGVEPPSVQPGFDSRAFLSQVGQVAPLKALEWEQKLAKDDTPVVVSPGAALVTRRGQEVYRAPKEEKPLELERMLDAAGITDPAQRSHFLKLAVQKQTTHQPSTTVNVGDNLGLKPKDRFEMEGKLSDDFLKATALDRNVLTSASKIRTALGLDGALKDQAAIYAFAKGLDPEGAVREADYAAISNSAGLIDRVRNYSNMLLKGERLTPTQRQEMVNFASAWEKVANSRIQSQRSRFSSQAQRYNLSPEAVLDPNNNANSGWSITPIGGK
jgi:hypothetical protein